MVHFISQRPSMSGTKNYLNHRTAFEGQFRMPRPQGRVINKKVYNFVNNNYCNHQMAPLLPPRQQITFPDIINFINNFFFKGETQPPKNDPVTTETIIKPETSETVVSIPETEPTVETNLNVEEKIEGAEEEKLLTTLILDEQMDRIQVTGNDCKLSPTGNQKEYMAPLWGTVAKSYTDEQGNPIPNTLEFRKFFRETCLNDKNVDIYNLGKDQHFPNEITFKGKTYTFNKETFINKENWDHYLVDDGSGIGIYGNMAEKKIAAKEGTQTITWTGTTRFTQFKDINGDGDYKDAGEVTEFTWTATSNKSEDDVREQLKAKVDAENKLSKDDKTIAFGNITKATVTKKEEK